jgi:hypothetical protein
MEKLNNGEALPLETRLEMYLDLLKIYRIVSVEERYWDTGFCVTAKPILTRYFNTLGSVLIDEHPYLLPELWELRTVVVKYNQYWYNNVKERIEALDKAIEIVSRLLNAPANTNT